jgi:hypothetical protein
MALEKRISELTAKSGLIGDTDLMVISQLSDGVYSTKKVTGAQLKTYNTYLASISQSGTSAPTVNYEYSGLTSTISWAYISTGIYEATLTDAELTLNKTFLSISLGSGTIGFYTIVRTTTAKFRVSTYSSLGVLTNGLLLDSQIEIKIIK